MSEKSQIADVIIIGGGAMGSSTAYQLASQKVDKIIVLDSYSPGHELGSSHGGTRITRALVAESKIHSDMAYRSHDFWRDLEDRRFAARRGALFKQVGFLVIDQGGYTRFDDAIAKADFWARPGEARMDKLGIDELRDRFPQFNIPDECVGLYDPTGGVLAPEICVKTQRELAEATERVEFKDQEAATSWDREGAGFTVTTKQQVYKASWLVFAIGARLPAFIGGRIGRHLRVCPQIQHWFQSSNNSWSGENTPSFAWILGKNEMFYGTPDPFGSASEPLIKAATEQWKEICEPDDVETPVTAVEKQEFFDKFVKGRLVGVDSPAFKASRCLYTYNPPWPDSKSDLNFIVDCHPDSEKAIVISACSGHGFKHSPAIGEKVANYILHGTELPREFKIPKNQIAEIGL